MVGNSGIKNVGKIVAYAGSYFSAVVGAGFASGQEIMVFYTRYGVSSLAAILLATALFIWIGLRFASLGSELETDSLKPAMIFLCGRYVGKAFDIILLFFMFASVSIMISGGGTALDQYFGVNPYVGRIAMGAGAVLIVSYGLQATLRVNGVLGSIIVLATLIVAIYSIAFHTGTLAEARQLIESSHYSHPAPNIWISVLIYVTYCVVGANGALLISIGNNEKNRSLRRAGIIGGAVALGVALLSINAAMLLNYARVANSELPFVELAQGLGTVIGSTYGAILVAAIFSTAIVGLYGIISRVSICGTRQGNWIAVGVAVAATVVGFVPFSTLVGTVYPVKGYIGLVIFISIVRQQIKGMRARTRTREA